MHNSHPVQDSFFLEEETDTFEFGALLGELLKDKDVICFSGDLGAGKTTMIKGIAKGMKISAEVTSPTFLLVQEYEGSLPLFHFDAYRIEDSQELLDIGFDDYRNRRGVLAMEWAELAQNLLPSDRLEIRLFRTEEDQRKAEVIAYGEHWKEALNMLRKQWTEFNG